MFLIVNLTVAAQVLSKRPHVLHNAELTVRKPASKDQWRLLLCGISPGTHKELIELYVENMMDMEEEDYTLYPSPGRDLILIHLRQPLSKGPVKAHFFVLCIQMLQISGKHVWILFLL